MPASFFNYIQMLHLIKFATISLIFSIKIIAVSAEEIPKISEQTFLDGADYQPSTLKSKPLMATDLADHSLKSTDTKVSKSTQEQANSSSAMPLSINPNPENRGENLFSRMIAFFGIGSKKGDSTKKDNTDNETLADPSTKSTSTKVSKPTLEKNNPNNETLPDPSTKSIGSKILPLSVETKDSLPPLKVKLFTPIKSLTKHPDSIVLSLKDAIVQALSNNISIVSLFNER